MIYDVAIIGGGPAGMMAAGRAAECGARVVLLEKNPSLGTKLLITGGGRSNVTNAEFDPHIFLSKFGRAGKFLFSPLSQFGVQDAIDFFHAHGMPTKIEAEKRVFPVSDSAQSVWDMLVSYMRAGGVTVLPDAEVAGIDAADGRIASVRLKQGERIEARAYILATGGTSHPETGSTGDGFRWLEKIGHAVDAPRPALVPLRVREPWIAELSGSSFEGVKLSVFQGETKHSSKIGKLLFTHFGLSGPLALNMSRDIDDLLKTGEVSVSVDLRPSQNIGDIDAELLMIFETQKNRQVGNALEKFTKPLIVPALLRLAQIDGEKPVHSVTRSERLAIVNAIKDIRLSVGGLLGTEHAIVTSGGVALREVDCKHMRSRLYPNLYLVGDILNIDRPSGGYSLQLCWTTGFVAGTAAAAHRDE